MPLKIQNYGDWKGDKPGGHHPPACTCYQCNEERRQAEASEEEERRVKEYDRRTAETQARSGGEKPKSNRSPSQSQTPAPSLPQRWHSNQSSPSQSSKTPAPSQPSQPNQPPQASPQQQAPKPEIIRQSEPEVVVWPATPPQKPQKPQKPQRRQGRRVLETLKAITASALRYALALHTAAVMGLVGYALIQGGAPNLVPTLDSAALVYAQAWHEVGAMAGLG